MQIFAKIIIQKVKVIIKMTKVIKIRIIITQMNIMSWFNFIKIVVIMNNYLYNYQSSFIILNLINDKKSKNSDLNKKIE